MIHNCSDFKEQWVFCKNYKVQENPEWNERGVCKHFLDLTSKHNPLLKWCCYGGKLKHCEWKDGYGYKCPMDNK